MVVGHDVAFSVDDAAFAGLRAIDSLAKRILRSPLALHRHHRRVDARHEIRESDDPDGLSAGATLLVVAVAPAAAFWATTGALDALAGTPPDCLRDCPTPYPPTPPASRPTISAPALSPARQGGRRVGVPAPAGCSEATAARAADGSTRTRMKQTRARIRRRQRPRPALEVGVA